MKRQVFTIHGGDAFATYEEYITALKAIKLDFEQGQRKGWKSNLQEALGENFEVVSPRMPNANNAKYEEWKIWFEKYIPFMRDGVVLIGHSLGGIFLAKYLAENRLPVKIAATFLVAARFLKVGGFTPPDSHELLQKQGGILYLFHSKDDDVVPFDELTKYQDALPTANSVIFTDRGHFNGETLLELVERIFALG